jgi:hypothetical protein
MAAVGAAGVAAGVAAGIDIQGTACKELFVTTFPGTVFLDPPAICSCFEINNVWKLSDKAPHHDVQTVVASLQFHSLQILSTTPDSDSDSDSDSDPTRPHVYHANLEYEVAPLNVTRITGADLVPQHAYYYLVMKIYELFLHPAASESMFHPDMDIVQFITQELNSGLADGRVFFEERVNKFFQSNPEFLKHTDPEELQTSIAAVWDVLRSDEYTNADNTVQKGIVSTIALDDVKKYSLKGQGRVTREAEEAFNKTVYGFHVLVYIHGHVISMSLSREDLFSSLGRGEETVFSFFNSDMIKYMASADFMKQVNDIIQSYNAANTSNVVPLLQIDQSSQLDQSSHHLIISECGCKSPGLLHYDSTGKLTLTTDTKLLGRREHIVGQAGDGRRYILVDNFPLPGSRSTRVVVTSFKEFTVLPNFCEYDNMAAVHRVLRIEFGDNGEDSVSTVYGDSYTPVFSLDPEVQMQNAVAAIEKKKKEEEEKEGEVEEVEEGEVGPQKRNRVDAVVMQRPGLLGRVRTGLGTACNFIRGIFGYSTPTCSANINHREHVVFVVPTEEEDENLVTKKSMPQSMTKWPWLEARARWLGKVVGMSAELGGGRRPVSRKYRNNKKNISRKKGKKRMSLRHRRSRRRLRRRSRSRCLK